MSAATPSPDRTPDEPTKFQTAEEESELVGEVLDLSQSLHDPIAILPPQTEMEPSYYASPTCTVPEVKPDHPLEAAKPRDSQREEGTLLETPMLSPRRVASPVVPKYPSLVEPTCPGADDSERGGSSGDDIPMAISLPERQQNRNITRQRKQQAPTLGKAPPKPESDSKTLFYLGVTVVILAILLFSPWTSKYIDSHIPIKGRGLWAAKGAIVIMVVLVLSLLL